MENKTRVLFLCTGNSCRSQMAEGLCNHLNSQTIQASSAGLEKHGLNPWAVEVMQEIGIDISGHKSKTVEELPQGDFDFVVTVCGHANETCPIFPGRTKVIHRGFQDPPRLAANLSSDEEILAVYRRVRDEIKEFILHLPSFLKD